MGNQNLGIPWAKNLECAEQFNLKQFHFECLTGFPIGSNVGGQKGNGGMFRTTFAGVQVTEGWDCYKMKKKR